MVGDNGHQSFEKFLRGEFMLVRDFNDRDDVGGEVNGCVHITTLSIWIFHLEMEIPF